MRKRIANVGYLETSIAPIAYGCGENQVLSIAMGVDCEERVLLTVVQMGYQIETVHSRTMDKLEHELMEYFAGSRSIFTIPPVYLGTPFQVKVWKALCTIPYGKIISYGELARLAGHPNAARAAGSAMAKNRIPIVIPCHRVVAALGKLGGFGCGLEVKRALLELEGAEIYSMSCQI